jgi:metal-responsive CopG/Arc/MetJ family transcriptional regulator
MHMDELRSERFSVSLTPSMLAKLDAYAVEHRWTRSTAAAVLIERGLDAGSKTTRKGQDHSD